MHNFRPPSRLHPGLPYRSTPSLSPRALLTRHSSTAPPSKDTPPPTTTSLPTRWLHDLKLRLGAILTFGLNNPSSQLPRTAQILRTLGRDWRELVAGSEGFLTERKRVGLWRQEVVWGEMDSMGHVNNVVYNRYAESGRVGWIGKIGTPAEGKEGLWRDLVTPRGVGVILRRIETEFKFPMTFPDRVTVYHKLRHEPTDGTDSFVLDVLIMSEFHQRIAARVVEDIVVYDYRKGKKTAMPDWMLNGFRETYRLQEEAKRRNTTRVIALSDEVRQLEKETWDRPDAKEDLGSAAKT